VDDDVVSALEAAIADLGTLLVQMDKFRAAEASDARALRAACLALGDRARRAHRHGMLDAVLATELRTDAAEAQAMLERWLGELRASRAYRDAVEALGTGDDGRLRTSLCALFAGVDAVDPPDVLFHPVSWQRRGRPRRAAEVADEIVRLRAEGLDAESDPATPGVDPALPGVFLHATPPLGAPVFLVLRGAARPGWVLRLATSGDLIAPGPRLRTPFTVGLAAVDDEDLDAWSPVGYREDLETALVARRVPLDETGGEE